MANESLRLTPAQIADAESAAAGGDAEAAKRLWHHYDFVAYDYPTAETWKATYDRLKRDAPNSN